MSIDIETLNPNAGPIGKKAPDDQINRWVEQFHRDGFLFLPEILPSELIPVLKSDLDDTDRIVERNPAQILLPAP